MSSRGLPQLRRSRTIGWGLRLLAGPTVEIDAGQIIDMGFKQGKLVYLSDLKAAKAVTKPFFSGGSLDPAVLTCAAKPGPAVFVNLVPGPDDTFSLIVAPVDVVAEDASVDPAMRDVVRTWIRPQARVTEFLEAYSRAGGTHHSALVLGDRAEAVAAFGRMSGLDVVCLGRDKPNM